MLEKFDDIVFSNHFNANSDSATFFSADVGLTILDLNNVSLHDINFEDNDPETRT